MSNKIVKTHTDIAKNFNILIIQSQENNLKKRKIRKKRVFGKNCKIEEVSMFQCSW